jgi:DNA-directed RNA polymerase specialized sigma24 family protein
VTEQALARARAGDEDAFRELTDPYQRELRLHIYRMLGPLQDAEDLLQETLLAAWRGLERFEERASVRSWLYRIATNRQGRDVISAFLRGAQERRGVPLRLVATRANTQPAFGCYLPAPETGVARAFSLLVLTLAGHRISAITWFADSGVFRQFGLPRMLRWEA